VPALALPTITTHYWAHHPLLLAWRLQLSDQVLSINSKLQESIAALASGQVGASLQQAHASRTHMGQGQVCHDRSLHVGLSSRPPATDIWATYQ
jgi:hypothetical protein